ncbi:MAG TPA: efflux RND transporter periplasmic adaptor subunit [Acidobacteriaceae bacterium]|nr:efflux RND transporter periplasmic adaptor subunit [Acidobacteriaceae bacterium]
MVWIVLLLVFAAGFYLVLRHSQAPKQGPRGGRRGGGAAGGAVSLTAETARKGDIGVYVNAIGTVTPVYTSSITSQVNGIVTAVHYTEGQMVRKGDALVDIDPRPYQATLMQSEGTLEHDQGLLAQAEMDLARYQAAWARNAIPKQQVDDQEKLVEQEKGTVKNDQGTVQYDQIQLGFCHIVSPISGRVGLRLVDPGNVVQANSGTVLAVITQIQPITVVFTVAEDRLGEILPQMRKRARLEVDALDRTGVTQIAKGSLLTLDNQIDTTTGTVKARAQFDNRDGSLFPNQFVNARLLVNTLTGVTLIPTAAIQHNGQEAYVYVISDGHAHMTKITAGVTEGDTAQVTGINPGDVLATSGFEKLQDNAPVRVSAPGGNPTAGGRRGKGRGQNGGSAPSGSGTP